MLITMRNNSKIRLVRLLKAKLTFDNVIVVVRPFRIEHQHDNVVVSNDLYEIFGLSNFISIEKKDSPSNEYLLV